MIRLAFAVLAAVLVVCGCGGARKRASGIVPWVDRPIPLYVAPDAKLIRYPTTAPRCRSGQLRVTQGRGGAGLGNDLEELVFTNTSARPCLLRGYPRISGVSEDGIRRPLRPQRGGTYFGQLLPADLRPGAHVFLDLATSVGCEGGAKAPVRYHGLVFSLPNGGRVSGGRVSVSEVCGLSMSAFGLPERYVEPRSAPGTAGTLQADIRFPHVVEPGTTVHFTVVLLDPTGVTVRLQPCPGYTVGIYAGAPHERSLLLNCDSVREIRPHERVRYEMELDVPAKNALTIAKIGWSLDTPNGPFAGAAARIG